MANPEKIDFVWRYQPLKNTADAVLLTYIKQNEILPVREVILQSLRAYWLPLAYQQTGEFDPVLLEQLFRKAVYALEKHALYLCDQVGIDYSSNFPNFYREDGIKATWDSSSVHPNLTTENLLELVGGDEFNDSGFS
ncbi:hypothetical protein PCC9214_05698 [Planktothrix tepida]|uniref:Uncharacterized protein n=1 Tax=Planktothrix tepida PCC 9214 TaxID=671072 RepID=A0A1J1LSN0_9CYAN|nr:hypothetical protein [Planktothrix tepida]CAD5990022.1 hypothetical protein PCC9214_05698 [Planktothrix tepida]CUR35597.1 hypothetical protein PL9214670223 [Planktothrix tepida PCC 9214]